MTSQLRKINNVIEQFLLPLAEAVSGWSTLAAIRSALIVTLPLMFLGSLAELMISFPLDAYKEFMFRQFGPEWRMFGQILKDATFSVMSLIMVFSIGHHLADQFNHDNPVLRANPVIAGLVAFTAFFCLLQQDGDALNRRWLGVAGLFVAILVGVFATRLFLYFFSIKRLHLHLPGGTPDIAIPQAFNAFIPGMLTVLVFAALGAAMQTFVGMSLHEALYQIIRMPFDAIGEGLGRGMLYILSLHALWFAGIHGANVLDPITHDIYGAAMLANEVAAAAGEPLPHIMTKTFMDTFVFMGGAGTGISLAGALILFGKTQASRKIGIFSLVPGLFNINEVLLFGLPIVLNPLMLIPFLLTPVLLAAISYVAVATGLVPGTNVATEWTTPILLNGYLSTGSLSGSALQLANLVVGVLIYAPFVLIANKIKVKQINDAFRSLLRRSCATADSSRRCLDHNDDAGSLARSLITDLEYDYRHGEGLFLEFQPQICSRTGRVVGVESLIRWKHPSYGLIPAPITVALAEGFNTLLAVAGSTKDSITLEKVEKEPACYTLPEFNERQEGVANWFKRMGSLDLESPMEFPEGYYTIKDSMAELAKNEEAFAIVAKAVKLVTNFDLKPGQGMWSMMSGMSPEHMSGMISTDLLGDKFLPSLNAQLIKIKK